MERGSWLEIVGKLHVSWLKRVGKFHVKGVYNKVSGRKIVDYGVSLSFVIEP